MRRGKTRGFSLVGGWGEGREIGGFPAPFIARPDSFTDENRRQYRPERREREEDDEG